MRCPWLCLKVLLGKCSKHPACRKEGRKSISTWVCPSQKYYLTSAPDRDVLMAVRNVPVFDKLVRFSAHSGHGISTSSQGDQGILARQTHLATLVLCSWDANLTASSQRRCHLGSGLQIRKRRDDQVVFLQTRVTNEPQISEVLPSNPVCPTCKGSQAAGAVKTSYKAT